MENILIEENGIHLVFRVLEDGGLRFLHCSAKPFREEEVVACRIQEGFPLAGVQMAGLDRPYERHGNKFIVTAPGYRLTYAGREDTRNGQGRRVDFLQRDGETGVEVRSCFQFYDGLPIFRCWTQVENRGQEVQTLEYLSSFHYEGVEKEGAADQDEKLRLWIPHNSWMRELNWKEYTLPQLGMERVQPRENQHSSSLIRVSNTGNWSTKEYLPMGYLENTCAGTGLYWQIEHNGSWHWEIGDQNGHLYLALSGPNEIYSHWSRNLMPGESFTTVPAAVGVTDQGMAHAMGVLTRYRRRIRRPNRDNENLPVTFNDYMNCLWGQPTAERELPLIQAAAEAGCEYFVIDAGWYADGPWWDNVGEWQESKARFPQGLRQVTGLIRAKGMVPGVWLEPEVMGIHCGLVQTLPQDWFFLRHGKRVYDRSRYQLDYRNPQVRAYMDGVVDRLVEDYGIGYIKTDYNIEPGIGTEWQADSPGDGLLEHERAYLAWLDGIFRRHPELVIENCSSGGLRMDYALLSRLSIQSTSDQEDYLMYPVIAANAPTGVTPEQAAVWSYPMTGRPGATAEDQLEETVFNMVSSLLLRIHLSGHLARLDPVGKALVREGISLYQKELRKAIPQAVPFWPLGLASYKDAWVALGLEAGETAYLALWRRGGGAEQTVLPLPQSLRPGPGQHLAAECVYPAGLPVPLAYDRELHALAAAFPRKVQARLFRLRLVKAE